MYNNDNKRAAACERSKLVFKTLSLQPLLGLRGGSTEGFHDPRLSSSDGMGYTLLCNSTVQVYTAHVGTELHCQHSVQVKCGTLCATDSWPLTLLQFVRQSLQLYQENWHAAVQQSSSALKYIALEKKRCIQQHCNEVH